MIIPTEPLPPIASDPRSLFIYSVGKAGKTTVTSQLKDALHVCIDPTGADHVSAVRVPTPTTQDIAELIKELEKGHSFKYIVLDDATTLDEICVPHATGKYNRSKVVTNNPANRIEEHDLFDLGYGTGHRYHREVFMNIIKGFWRVRNDDGCLIILGHIKDKFLDPDAKIVADGTFKKVSQVTNLSQVDYSTIDLTGQLRSKLANWVDANGKFYRDGGKGYLTFEASEQVMCGLRTPHLEGKTFQISEKQEDDSVLVDWSEIFRN